MAFDPASLLACCRCCAVGCRLLCRSGERQADYQAVSLVKRLVAADIGEVPGIVQELDGYRRWADPLLRQEDVDRPHRARIKSCIWLWRSCRWMKARLPNCGTTCRWCRRASFRWCGTLCCPYKDSVAEPLWNVALDSKREAPAAVSGSMCLGDLCPDDNRWSQINTFVAAHLVTLEASALVAWREALRPAKAHLIKPLASIYRDTKQKEQPRSFATETLADYAADQPDELFDLLADAEQFQFPVLFDKLAAHKDEAVALARRGTRQKSAGKSERGPERTPGEAAGQCRRGPAPAGNAGRSLAAAQVQPRPQGPQLRHSLAQSAGRRPAADHPATRRRVRRDDSAGLGAHAGPIYGDAIVSAQRQPLIEKLLTVYENEPDAGLHGAAEWLLRKWGQGERLEAVVEKLKSNEKQLQARKPNDKRQWYVNTQKQTFVIVDAG